MAFELSTAQRRTLEAATGRILPSDDGPGAAEAGVASYIEHVLGVATLPPVRQQIVAGLDELDEAATQAEGKSFADCEPTAQDTLLEGFQSSENRLHQLLLNRLVMLSLEGFLCHPDHGGNRGGVGWEYMGHKATADDAPLCSHTPVVTR